MCSLTWSYSHPCRLAAASFHCTAGEMCRRSSAARRSVLREALIDLRTRRQTGGTAAVNGHRSAGAVKLREAAPGDSEDLFRAYRTGPRPLAPELVVGRYARYAPDDVDHGCP